MELIKVENNVAVLNSNVVEQIVQYETMLKQIKEQSDSLKKSVLEAMEKANVIKIDTDALMINYIASSDREYFDKNGLRKDHPQLYDAYVTMKPVKPSIRIKVK